MVQTNDIRRELVRFLDGAQSLRDTVLTLATHGWELRDFHPGSPALEAIRTFELLLAEHPSGGDVFKQRLRQLVSEMASAETVWTNIIRLRRRSSSCAHTEYVEATA